MRNTGIRLLRLSVGVCVAVLLAGPAAAQNTDQQFTGSWIHYLNVSGTPSGPLLPALVTIQSDGTMIISSGLMFGSPSMPAAPVRLLPAPLRLGESRPQDYYRDRLVLRLRP